MQINQGNVLIRVALDFAPGSHGHFLELVLNKYIYGVTFPNTELFQSSGAVHPINLDREYQAIKVVDRGHFTSFNDPIRSTVEKIVFINHCQDLDFVLLTNIHHRCHPASTNVLDFNVEIINKLHLQHLAKGTNLDLRKNWYAKLDERLFLTHSLARPQSKLPVYDFDYKSFFDLNNFCVELQKTAHFLEETFKFDVSLAKLWHEFMDRNQGWNLYQQAESIIASTVSGQESPIPDDWKLHAYLNFRLSKMFDIYDGVLYNSQNYPATTLELLEIIQEHTAQFDNRW